MVSKQEEKEIYEEMDRAFKEESDKWEKAKNDLKDLIHPKYIEFAENHDSFKSEGVFEIEETDKRTGGYPNYRHCTVRDWQDNRLFIHHTDTLELLDNESEYEGEEIEYWVWQTTGYLGDDYSGYLLLPMLNGKYWMVGYSC